MEGDEKVELQERLVHFCRSFFPGGSVADRPPEDHDGPETKGAEAQVKRRRKKPSAELAEPAVQVRKRQRRRGDWIVLFEEL